MITQTSEAGADFDELYRSQWHNMVRVAMFLVDDVESAKDCVQDAFVSVYRRPPRNPAAQVGYLHRAVVNASRSALRRRGTARRHLRTVEPDAVESADKGLLVGVEHAAMIAALGTLPTRQREVLVLRYWAQLSEAEIAEALGMRPGTVKSTASRALTALETKLGDLR